jgi:hypothetical protein
VKTIAILLGVTSSILVAAPIAHAEEEALAPESVAPRRSVDRLKSMWRFELGYRGAFVSEAGYNPFSTHDYFAQVSMGGSRTVYTRGSFSLSPGFSWDYGRSSASARGDATSLDLHRLVVSLEGRMHFGAWGYAFVRAAPGVALENAEVDDPTSPAPLTKSRWLFATDLSAGYAYPLWPRAEPWDRTPRVWLQADGGYGWIATQALNLSPELSSSDARIASGIDLGSLAMRGAFFRIAAAVSF